MLKWGITCVTTMRGGKVWAKVAISTALNNLSDRRHQHLLRLTPHNMLHIAHFSMLHHHVFRDGPASNFCNKRLSSYSVRWKWLPPHGPWSEIFDVSFQVFIVPLMASSSKAWKFMTFMWLGTGDSFSANIYYYHSHLNMETFRDLIWKFKKVAPRFIRSGPAVSKCPNW